jgi:DNA-binding beta-propeller fold protein YncE
MASEARGRLARGYLYSAATVVAAVMLATVTASGANGHARTFYQLESTLKMRSARPDWDYLCLDQARGHLFIARRRDGATVVDVESGAVIGTIARSQNANSIVLAEPFDRGYSINSDGSATVFELSSLKTLGRVRFGDDADAAVFEPVTKQIVVMMADSHSIAFLEGATSKVLGRIEVDTDKLEAPTADGKGAFFVAERHRNSVAKIDAVRRRLVAEWKLDGCEQPSGLAFDAVHGRLFVGCRGHGRNPVLAVVNSGSGRVIATLEIGRGNDGVIYDAGTRKVYTSNGVDGNLVVYDQLDANTYTLSEATTTRPYARTMAMDHRTKKIYLVTAEGTVDPSRKVNRGPAPFYPNRYFSDTFVLLTYSPK